MSQNGNAQGAAVDSEAVIRSLVARISSLTMELAMKEAYVEQLSQALAVVSSQDATAN